MMRNYGYRVVATTRAEDLPLIINNKDKKIDLVLAEFRLIEMNKYELLEKIKLICEIPVVVSGAYASDAIVECLCRGAKFCLNKPLMEDNLDYLWQFTFRSTVGREPDFLSQTDINISEKHDSVVHNQSLRDELKKNNNNEVKTEDLDEYKGENFESGDQKKPDLRCPEMQNEYRETDDEPNQGKKRKERAVTDTAEHTENDRGTDLEQQKKPKHICADDLQNKTLEAVPKIEEAGNERKKPTEIEKNGEGSEKKKPELGCMEKELETWSTQPVTDFAAYAEYELEGRDFQPLESVGKSVDALEIASSPRESSNKSVVAQLQMPTDGALDEEVMWDGMSLSDLEFDLEEEEHGSNQELFDEIFNDLAKELKP